MSAQGPNTCKQTCFAEERTPHQSGTLGGYGMLLGGSSTDLCRPMLAVPQHPAWDIKMSRIAGADAVVTCQDEAGCLCDAQHA
jgi:hypothetical protein